jgi:hypothetical protein
MESGIDCSGSILGKDRARSTNHGTSDMGEREIGRDKAEIDNKED